MKCRRVRFLGVLLALWLALTVILCGATYEWFRIAPSAKPDAAARTWALQTLRDALHGSLNIHLAPTSAETYRAYGPVIAIAWNQGRVISKYVGSTSWTKSVQGAAQQFAALSNADRENARVTVVVVLGDGPLLLSIPWLSALSVVPLQEGIVGKIQHQSVYLTPVELLAEGYCDSEITPLPDLRFGINMSLVAERIARELGMETQQLRKEGMVRRFAALVLTEEEYPKERRVREQELREAAVSGARFLLRHQHADGHFTYLYDARTGSEHPAEYNLPRHSGTTYFLAQIDRLSDGFLEARTGAQRALTWLLTNRLRHCGAEENWCVEDNGSVDVGSSALALIAASEIFQTSPSGDIKSAIEGFSAFLRSMQRADGELMHEYDLAQSKPIDVQHLYYSGEAALALLRAHRVLGDGRNLEAAQKLLRHLTRSWNFFGSRYYYGEEHWTCIAADESFGRADTEEALEFCLRWAGYNRELQYQKGETLWPVSGAYGVGPILLPRLGPVSSRTEAFISTYELLRHSKREDRELRRQIEDGLQMLLRWQWRPGPQWFFADPDGAEGGMPGSPLELTIRNDSVQHACSAMMRWAHFLSRERQSGT